MRLIRTIYAVGGRPVEVADMVLAGDRYVLGYDVPGQRPPTSGSDDQ